MTSGDSGAVKVHGQTVPKRTSCVRCGKGAECVGEEALDDHVRGFVVIQTSAHQVVKLVVVNAGARGTVCGRHVVGQHFEFGDGVGTGALAQQQVAEDLTGIGAVGTGVDDQAPGADASAAAAAGHVGHKGGIRVSGMVVDLHVMVVMAAALAMNAQADSDVAAGRIEVMAKVRFSSELTSSAET